jgi:integrase/recombinase XerD
MGRVNIVKQIKVDGKWTLRSIPKKKSGHYDWAALPDGDYFVEWREDGRRRRQPAGNTAAQAMEEHRRKRHELEAHALGLAPRNETSVVAPAAAEPPSVRKLIDRYLDQIKTLKKPNTHRKYDAVLTRFAKVFDRRTLDSISTEELNDYVVALMNYGMSANTVLHNVVIIAQFCKRNGRPGLTRLLHLPERILPLPLEYTEEELASFFEVTTDRERELFSTFLLTGFREQEVVFLFWSDINLKLRTIRVTSEPHLCFSPKRWEEREIPIPAQLARLLETRPHLHSERFVFPSPTGNREHNMLLKCKAIAERAGLDSEKFDLKTFRSTYATRMLRSGFDVRTVQHWMGHKSLETTMRYLVPASDVHDRLDQVVVPSVAKSADLQRKSVQQEVAAGRKPIRRHN